MRKGFFKCGWNDPLMPLLVLSFSPGPGCTDYHWVPGSPPAPHAPGTQSACVCPAALSSAGLGHFGHDGTWETHTDTPAGLFFNDRLHLNRNPHLPIQACIHQKNNITETTRSTLSAHHHAVIIYHVSHKHILYFRPWRYLVRAEFIFEMVRREISKCIFSRTNEP